MSNKMNGCYKLIHIRLTPMQSDIEYYLRQSPPLWKVNILNIGNTNFLSAFFKEQNKFRMKIQF